MMSYDDIQRDIESLIQQEGRRLYGSAFNEDHYPALRAMIESWPCIKVILDEVCGNAGTTTSAGGAPC